ncbi:hypothetical protein [Vibrio campbellii]|uniref:hypothetical protein n=1 Tax=Vibrio campbellii TaxID=680 RepID=UPI0011826CF6|nr:hypothetical protein [Vibrio campbellii]
MSSVLMLIYVDYSPWRAEPTYLFRRGTCLQSMLVVQYSLRFIAVLTPSVIVPHPMLHPLR